MLEHGTPARTASSVNRTLSAVFGFYEFHARGGVPLARELVARGRSGYGSYKPFLHGIAKTEPRGTVGRLAEVQRLPRVAERRAGAGDPGRAAAAAGSVPVRVAVRDGDAGRAGVGASSRGCRELGAADRDPPARGQRQRRARQGRSWERAGVGGADALCTWITCTRSTAIWTATTCSRICGAAARRADALRQRLRARQPHQRDGRVRVHAAHVPSHARDVRAPRRDVARRACSGC